MAACALSISVCKGTWLAGSRPGVPSSFLRPASVALPLSTCDRLSVRVMRLHSCCELSPHLGSMLDGRINRLAQGLKGGLLVFLMHSNGHESTAVPIDGRVFDALHAQPFTLILWGRVNGGSAVMYGSCFLRARLLNRQSSFKQRAVNCQ